MHPWALSPYLLDICIKSNIHTTFSYCTAHLFCVRLILPIIYHYIYGNWRIFVLQKIFQQARLEGNKVKDAEIFNKNVLFIARAWIFGRLSRRESLTVKVKWPNTISVALSCLKHLNEIWVSICCPFPFLPQTFATAGWENASKRHWFDPHYNVLDLSVLLHRKK